MKQQFIVLVGASAVLVACGTSTPAPAYPYHPTPRPHSTATTHHPLSDAPVASETKPRDTAVHESQPPPAPAHRSPPVEDPKLFSSFVDIIKRTVPTGDQGAAVAVRFVNTQTGYRYSSGFVSEKGFVPFQGFPGKSIAIATSDAGETFTIVMSTMRPGHFECGTQPDFALEFATAGVRGNDPQASWSDNPNGDCEIDIYAGDNPGDYQGKISGKLISNDGKTVFTLEAGYFYARRPYLAGQAPAGPSPSTRPPPPGNPKLIH